MTRSSNDLENHGPVDQMQGYHEIPKERSCSFLDLEQRKYIGLHHITETF